MKSKTKVWIRGMFWLPALGIIESWQQHAHTNNTSLLLSQWAVPIPALWGWKCDKCAAMLFTLLRSPMMGQCEPHPPVLTSDARGWPVTNQRPGLRLWTNGSPSRVPGPAPTLRPETPESRRTGAVSGKHRPVHHHGHNVTRIVMRLHLTFKSEKHKKNHESNVR